MINVVVVIFMTCFSVVIERNNNVKRLVMGTIMM